MNSLAFIPDTRAAESTLEKALIFAAHGLYILPVAGGGKNPGELVGAGWPEKSTTDPAAITRWWQQWPESNIGLHCGRSGLVAFDLDEPELIHPVLAKVIAETLPPYQSTRSNREHKGHYFFSVTAPGVGNSVKGLPGGWGEIRSKNAIVVIGGAHEKAAQGGRYAFVRTGWAPWLPPELAKLLREPGASGSGTDAQTDAFLASFEDEEETGLECPEVSALLNEPWNAQIGGRHDEMNAKVLRMLRLGERGHYGVREALDELKAQFLEELSGDRDGESEWARGLNGGVAEVMATPSGFRNCGQQEWNWYSKFVDLDAVMKREQAKRVVVEIPAAPVGAPIVDLTGYAPSSELAFAPAVVPANAKWAYDRITKGARQPLYRWDGEWYLWEGNHYRKLGDGELNHRLWKLFDAAKYTKPATLQADAKEVPWCPNPTTIGNVAKGLEGLYWLDSRIADNTWMTGNGPRVMPFNNYLLDTDTLQPVQHSPAFFNTACSPVNYDPNAPEPTQFLKVLSDQWGENSAQQLALQEFIGYLFSGETRYQKMLLIYGEKRSGKGTIVKVLQQLLGDARWTSLTSKAFETEYGVENLVGTDMAVLDDKQDGGDTSAIVERLLSIIGEAAVSIPRKFKKAWVGRLRTKFVITANGIPKLHSKSGSALAARVIPLNFGISFEGREDRYLEERVMAELPAIVNWGLAGLQRLRANRAFTESMQMVDERRQIAGLSDPLEGFIADCLVPQQDSYIAKDDLWVAWGTWSTQSNNLRVGGRTDFLNRLKGRMQLQDGKRGPRGQQRPALVNLAWSEERPQGVGPFGQHAAH